MKNKLQTKNRRDTKLKLHFKKKNKVFLLSFKRICDKFKVKNVIKFTKKEFKSMEMNLSKNFFCHFNIHDADHKKNQNFLLVKIIRKGYSKKNKHIQPLLSYKKFYLAKCLYVKNYIKYENLKCDHYKNNLYGIKNVSDLKKNILSKYKTILMHLNNRQKIMLGVAVTKLKVLKKYENY